MVAGDYDAQSSRPQIFRRWIVGLLTLFAFLAALPTYLAFGARYWWVLELATHFRAYYALGLAPIALVLLICDRWKLLAWVAIALVVNVFLVAPLYLGDPGQAGPRSLRVLSANVLSTNLHYDRLLDLIRQEAPDVVVVLEVNGAWGDRLSELEAEYPHSLVEPRKGSFGIALFSKLPTEQLEIADIGGNGLPSIRAIVRVDETPIYMIATHPPPPMSREMASQRNKQLAALAEELAGVSGPRLLVGDLNITPWSPYFQDLLRVGKLQNSQQGFGIQSTWFVRLPIDHLLHSADLAIIDRRVGPQIGSDHRPLIVDLSVKHAPQ